MLSHISVRIEAGQTVALVGPTGSGKSTLISLLARLHDPPPGTVFVDGVDVRELPLETLRGAIGFVPQEPFLFSDTLADNVAFGLDARHGRAGPRGQGDPAARHDRIVAAAGVARLDKDVADFPKGYDTMVGERGITLSGGQKQRTALARAVAIDPRILILDDALSAVDTYTEEEILSRLRGVMRQRTSIIVSHRISTVRDADQILVLDGGRIVERGTHDDARRPRRPVRGAPQEAAARRGAGGVVNDDEVLGKAYDARLMRRLLAYLRPYWRQVAVALVAIIVGAAAQLAQPYLIKVAIDRYIAAGRLDGLGPARRAVPGDPRRRRSRRIRPDLDDAADRASGSCSTCGWRSTATCSGSTCATTTATRSAA